MPIKRVAICMRGGISKHTTSWFDCGFLKSPESMYKDAPYVNIIIPYTSIVKHIINANPSYHFDFFLQGWNVDKQEELVRLYKPKRYHFENNLDYKDAILKKSYSPDSYGNVSQCLSIKKTIALKEAYEKKHHLIYDIVIIFRYDIVLKKDMILSNYDVDHFIYSNQIHFLIPSTQYSVGDFHFVMNSKHSTLFKKIYDWITPYESYYTPHYFIPTFITSIYSFYKADSFIGIVDEEVMRKIHISKLKGIKNVTKLDLYYASFQTHTHLWDGLYAIIPICLLYSGMISSSYKHFFTTCCIICCIGFILYFMSLFYMDIEYALCMSFIGMTMYIGMKI